MYYFASDIHLGAGSPQQQAATEKLFVQWLDEVAPKATAIFLTGDVFDFWFEYKRVVPRGFVRTLGTIARITDSGVRVVFMAGNHDMWIRDYLASECGMELYTTPTTFTLAGRKVHVAHGDNLNIKGNFALKFMNTVFRSKALRILFASLIHPDLAMKFGQWWSGSSRSKHDQEPSDLPAHSMVFLEQYAERHYAEHHDEIYIFGHLHHKAALTAQEPQIIFMNDWSKDPHYATISLEGEVKLCSVKELLR